MTGGINQSKKAGDLTNGCGRLPIFEGSWGGDDDGKKYVSVVCTQGGV